MNRLWIKLLGAFAVVILIGVLVTVLVARQAAATQFSHLMIDNQMVRPASLQQAVNNFYAEQGSWDGIDKRLPTIVRAASDGGMMGGMMGGAMGMFDGRIRVADVHGTVVADTAGQINVPLETRSTDTQLPLMDAGNQVGTLFIDGPIMTMPMADDTDLMTGLTRAILTGAVIAGLVALLLAAFVVRQITRPVVELGSAAQQIAEGDFATRVTIRSGDELGDLAGSFNSMAESLQGQEQLRRNLMADIAHELRTPLSGIQGNIEALQDGVFPLTPENLEPIHDQTLLLNRLVDDLRTLALADAGELTLAIESVDLGELVTRTLDSFRSQVHASQISLKVGDFSGRSTVVVAGDRMRLSQVATNLIDNALRHTPSGGTVTVDMTLEGATVRWYVTDNGEGIAAADLPHIFDRFYRADGSRSRRRGGSGLGLTIVKQIITAHGGVIDVTSPSPGAVQGTRFTVTLPAG